MNPLCKPCKFKKQCGQPDNVKIYVCPNREVDEKGLSNTTDLRFKDSYKHTESKRTKKGI